MAAVAALDSRKHQPQSGTIRAMEHSANDTASDATAALQLRPNGRLRHLLTLEGLSAGHLTDILDRAEQFLSSPGEKPARSERLQGRTVANLFFEPSTRTRASFELAAKRLSADVLNLDVNTSSRIKGESILDTIVTLQSMHCDAFVVRDASTGVPEFIARNVAPHVSVLNAGEADCSHPTQGLLDVLTIRQQHGRFDGLKVAIVGDIAHSRVARSAYFALTTLGVTDLRLIAPRSLAPTPEQYPDAHVLHDLETGLRDADVVMALRIQRERLTQQEDQLGEREYHEEFGINTARMALASPKAIVMHPGPMNRGVEIDDAVADGPQSVIAQQVTNGLAIRMAVLTEVIGEPHT